MLLEVGREDLHPDHADRPCSKIRYEHLTAAAKAVVAVVGRATL